MTTLVRTYEEILAAIAAVDVVAYERTRNHLEGAVSRLSPYLTRGVITLPQVRDYVLARKSVTAARKFIQELAWREYFQRVWWQRGDEIFTDVRPGLRTWRHHEVPEALVTARTGIIAIDQAITDLYETGYVHNHARMWIAGLATNLARAHWLSVSRWFYYHLCDGDIASNTLSWQWVAGTLTGKPYDFNEALINACSSQPQHGTYLAIDRSELHTMPVPAVLQVHTVPTLPVVLPKGDLVPAVAGKVVRLYHPFHLDPTWRSDEKAVNVLLLDPRHFERFPVSTRVLEFIVAQARAVLPELSVHVGTYDAIPGITNARVYTRFHPSVAMLPVMHDGVPLLFPQVAGTFASFSAFWRQCERHL